MDACATETDDDYCLLCVLADVGGRWVCSYPPIPMVFEAIRDYEIAQDHDDYIWNQSQQPHLRLPDALVSLGQSGTDQIAGGTCGK